MDFWGFQRSDERTGLRNHVLIMPASHSANHTVSKIVQNVPGVVSFKHQHGNNQTGRDLKQTKRVLLGFATHPNVYGVVVIGMGNEDITAEEIGEEARSVNKPAHSINITNQGGMRKSIEYGCELATQLLNDAKKAKRKRIPIGEIILGTECGGSDACSGISANPAVGVCSDYLVNNGGTTLLSESMELVGAEHLLAERAATPEIKQRVFNVIERTEQGAMEMGVDIRGTQPARGNIEGGITTIEEKSLGCIYKGGTTPLIDIIEYAESPRKKGLIWMDTPGHDIEQLAGMVAGGCQVAVFTSGRGTPAGSPIAPVIKMASNSQMYENMKYNMDINAGYIIDGFSTVKQVGEQLFSQLRAVASGAQTRSEILGHHEFGIYQIEKSV